MDLPAWDLTISASPVRSGQKTKRKVTSAARGKDRFRVKIFHTLIIV
jgi:hypothetical protein